MLNSSPLSRNGVSDVVARGAQPTQSPRLVVFADDWGRHPSSAQHLVSHLQQYYRVDWVNVAGTRRPRLLPGDLKRCLERSQQWIGRTCRAEPTQTASKRDGPGVIVHAPVHWPGFGSRLERFANGILLEHALGPLFSGDPGPAAVITTHSLVADLVRRYSRINWVYYMVDDLSVWPGLDEKTLRRMEAQMLPAMRKIIVSTEVLQQRLQETGYHSMLLTHGVDVDQWAGIIRRPLGGTWRRPKALYWGYADARLDVEVCLAVAEKCDLEIVGPRSNVNERLLRSPGITWRNPVPQSVLPQLAEAADVLVMPYARLPVTEAMQPLKLKEYLATPLPVISTQLPSTEPWADALDRTDDPCAFADLCVLRARQELPSQQVQARKRLVTEGWKDKAQVFEAMLGLGIPAANPQ